MTTTGDEHETTARPGSLGSPSPGARRWAALVFLALSQLMVALDNTVVSIALPATQTALGASDADRQWMVTAYTLFFGGLLLLGGRIADYVGRRRAFLVGLIGFAAASALGGAAVSFWMLVAARALQGGFAALLAPTALSLVSVMFGEPRERAKAFAAYGAVAGSGAAVGLVLGGALTEYASWRWCLYVNIPIALVAAVGGSLVLARSGQLTRPRLDVPGALLVVGGLVGLVYACSSGGTAGWTSARVVGSFVVGVVLLAAFVVVQARVSSPLLPLRILRDRNRVGANLVLALTVAGQLGVFLFLTFHLQVVLGYTPVETGLAFLPLPAALLVSSGAIASRLAPRVPPRVLLVPGLVVSAVAVAMFTQLTVESGYVRLVLPGLVLLGLGMGCVFLPAISTATQRVEPHDAGVASGLVTTSQMVGGSVGTALLNTVAAAGAASYLASHPGVTGAAPGLVHGYTLAAGWGAGLLAAAAVAAAVLVDAGKPEQPS